MTDKTARLHEAMHEAAALPPEAPHILEDRIDEIYGDDDNVDSSSADSGIEACAVIDVDEFEDDLRDPVWRQFCKDSLDRVNQLRAEGRSE